MNTSLPLSSTLPPDLDRGPSIQTAIWIPFIISLFLVALRFHIRRLRHLIGADDWYMLASLILYLAAAIYASYLISHGSTRHAIYLIAQDSDEFVSLSFGTTVVLMLGWLSYIMSKAAVALLIPRLLYGSVRTGKGKWRIWLLGGHVGVNAVLVVATIVVLFTKCVGVDTEGERGKAQVLDAFGRCKGGQERAFAVTTATFAFGAYLDFFLALFPTTFIFNLHTSLGHKLSISALLGLGAITGSVAIVKTVLSARWFWSSDPSWDSYSVYIWTFIEIGLLIICGSIPPVKPFREWLANGTPIDGSGGTSPGGSGGRGFGWARSLGEKKHKEKGKEKGKRVMHWAGGPYDWKPYEVRGSVDTMLRNGTEGSMRPRTGVPDMRYQGEGYFARKPVDRDSQIPSPDLQQYFLRAWGRITPMTPES